MTPQRRCAECDTVIPASELAVVIRVEVELPRTRIRDLRYQPVARMEIHKLCFHKTGLAGRWEELRDKV